jgi:hypothetical protein
MESVNDAPFFYEPGRVRFDSVKVRRQSLWARLWLWFRGKPRIYEATYQFTIRHASDADCRGAN